MGLAQERLYSYADILSWDTQTRYELFNGQLTALAAPAISHQRISREIYLQLGNYLKGKACEAFYAPCDVRLFEKAGDHPKDVYTIVQPDLMVVCDPRKIDNHGVHGAPDLIIEILSDSTQRTDRLVKFNLYCQAGVQEYWIVDPSTRTVAVYTLEDGTYHAAATYGADASVPVGILEDCKIDLPPVFPDPRKE